MSLFTRVAIALAGLCVAVQAAGVDRPNILWITTEDIGPHLGCYGDAYARTPNLDALAAKGVIYRHVWSSAPVCAPARTALITGVSPTSTGAEHMRSEVEGPRFMRMYPQILREAGYYCTNNNKEDYNLVKQGQVWDESSGKAHWRNRKPGQPFLAVFNINITHEGQIRKRPHEWKHDPAKARVPARQPEDIDVRQDWAQYYDHITEMDRLVAARLAELDQDGLADSTIVLFMGDNGPGLPGCKRSARDAGLHVPLIVYVPPKHREVLPRGLAPASKSDRLVSFVDFAPTLLGLAGVKPPAWMQGQAFLGAHATPDPAFMFGFRGRMDERQDLVRCVRNQRYVYVRNYMPHLPEGQHVTYMFETASTRAWWRLFQEGRLTATQAAFWQPRAPEELYDLQTDPDEAANLVRSPEHQQMLEQLRGVLRNYLLAVRDVGFLPEGEIHSRSQGSNPYDLGRDPARYPLERILDIAESASCLNDADTPRLVAGLEDADAAVRCWAALGILMRGEASVTANRAALEKAMHDHSAHVRIAAAEGLTRFAEKTLKDQATTVLVEAADLSRDDVYVAISALNALDRLSPRAAGVREAVARLPRSDAAVPERMKSGIPRLMDSILGAGSAPR